MTANEMLERIKDLLPEQYSVDLYTRTRHVSHREECLYQCDGVMVSVSPRDVTLEEAVQIYLKARARFGDVYESKFEEIYEGFYDYSFSFEAPFDEEAFE